MYILQWNRLAELAPEHAKLLARACPLSVRVTARCKLLSLSFLIRLLEDGKNDTHSEALLRAYSVAGNIYFCPEMSRGEHLKKFQPKNDKNSCNRSRWEQSDCEQGSRQLCLEGEGQHQIGLFHP